MCHAAVFPRGCVVHAPLAGSERPPPPLGRRVRVQRCRAPSRQRASAWPGGGAYDGAPAGSTPPNARPTGTFLPHRVLPTVRRRGQACGNPCHAPARGGAKREALAGTENRFRERVSERVLDWEFGAWCVRAHQACTREQGACKGVSDPFGETPGMAFSTCSS